MTKNTQLMEPQKLITNKLIHSLENFKDLNFIQFRDNIYNIFIYHLDVTICLKDIITHFIVHKKINKPQLLIFILNFTTF